MATSCNTRRITTFLSLGGPPAAFPAPSPAAFAAAASAAGRRATADGAAAAVGSGGPYALAAARALVEHSELDASTVASRALEIAADICIYTNREITLLELSSSSEGG